MPITFTFDPEPPAGPAEPDSPCPVMAAIGLADIEAAVVRMVERMAEPAVTIGSVWPVEPVPQPDWTLTTTDPDDTPLADLVTHTHLRSQRLAAGLSQATLAQRAGMTQGYITQIETGRRRPTERVVAAYRAAVNMGDNG